MELVVEVRKERKFCVLCHCSSLVPHPLQVNLALGIFCAMKFKIGELAKQSGCQVVTIRYYEKEGLLRRPERSEGNYRLYDEADVERLHFIRHCRLLDISLAEIKALLAFEEQPTVKCDWINTLMEQHIAAVDAQIASLQHLRQHLEDLRTQCAGGREHDCGIIKSLRDVAACPHCNELACPGARPGNVPSGNAGDDAGTKAPRRTK